MKVVYNACFGGFSLSPEALLLLWERGMKEIGTPVEEYYPPEDRKERHGILEYQHAIDEWREYAEMTPKQRKSERRMFLTVFSPDEKFVLSGGRQLPRNQPELIRVVEELGEMANGAYAKLAIVEIPDDVQWHVEEYDGNEHIAENHRTWS